MKSEGEVSINKLARVDFGRGKRKVEESSRLGAGRSLD